MSFKFSETNPIRLFILYYQHLLSHWLFCLNSHLITCPCIPVTSLDSSKGDPGSPATLWWHFWEEHTYLKGQQSCQCNNPPAVRWAKAALALDPGGSGKTPQTPRGSAQSPAILLWCSGGWGMDERAGAVHDVRRKGKGEESRYKYVFQKWGLLQSLLPFIQIVLDSQGDDKYLQILLIVKHNSF